MKQLVQDDTLSLHYLVTHAVPDAVAAVVDELGPAVEGVDAADQLEAGRNAAEVADQGAGGEPFGGRHRIPSGVEWS